MKKYFNTKEIARSGLLAAVMAVIGIIVSTLAAFTGKSILQFSDIIYLSLFSVVKPITLITSACIAGGIIDLYAGGFIYIPVTISVKILIGITYLFINKVTNKYFGIIISYLWIAIYILYTYLLYDTSAAIAELITDSIQYSFTVTFACLTVGIIDIKKLNLAKPNYAKNNYKS